MLQDGRIGNVRNSFEKLGNQFFWSDAGGFGLLSLEDSGVAVRETARIVESIFGDKLYQKRAREAFPLLVRQAEAGNTIYYSDLAKELGMPNERNLNYVLGSVGRAIEDLSDKWKKPIPPLQCLVINKQHALPGAGVGWFLIKQEEFANLSPVRQKEIIQAQLALIWAYPNWPDVLVAVGLSPTEIDFVELNNAAARAGLGGGESERHREFKNFVAANPSLVGLPSKTRPGKLEFSLPSGDSLDVSFQVSAGWVGVEVKSRISSEADLVRGLYQCVKYQAVMRAIEATENRERNARAVLVLEGELPRRLLPLKNILGVTVHENVRK